MSADWGSFFHSGSRSSHEEPKPENVSGDDEIVEPDQGNGTYESAPLPTSEKKL